MRTVRGTPERDVSTCWFFRIGGLRPVELAATLSLWRRIFSRRNGNGPSGMPMASCFRRCRNVSCHDLLSGPRPRVSLKLLLLPRGRKRDVDGNGLKRRAASTPPGHRRRRKVPRKKQTGGRSDLPRAPQLLLLHCRRACVCATSCRSSANETTFENACPHEFSYLTRCVFVLNSAHPPAPPPPTHPPLSVSFKFSGEFLASGQLGRGASPGTRMIRPCSSHRCVCVCLSPIVVGRRRQRGGGLRAATRGRRSISGCYLSLQQCGQIYSTCLHVFFFFFSLSVGFVPPKSSCTPAVERW